MQRIVNRSEAKSKRKRRQQMSWVELRIVLHYLAATWQARKCPGAISRVSGMVSAHTFWQ